jgi:hypothetical protein
MFIDDGVEYYAQRERMERFLAAEAKDEAERTSHLALAKSYRNKALDAGYRNEPSARSDRPIFPPLIQCL